MRVKHRGRRSHQKEIRIADTGEILKIVGGENHRRTAITPQELLVAVEVPRIEGRQWFKKVGTRAAQAIAKVSAAGVRLDVPRFALGSVAPTIVRARRAEAVLASGGSLEAAQAALQQEIAPIDDLRSTAVYRRRIAERLLARFLEETC